MLLNITQNGRAKPSCWCQFLLHAQLPYARPLHASSSQCHGKKFSLIHVCSAFVHGEISFRYIIFSKQSAHSSGIRHGLSTTHSRKSTGGVQHGRVSDLAKKRMGEVSSWATKAQQKMWVKCPQQQGWVVSVCNLIVLALCCSIWARKRQHTPHSMNVLSLPYPYLEKFTTFWPCSLTPNKWSVHLYCGMM